MLSVLYFHSSKEVVSTSIPVTQSWIFSLITPSFSVSWSFRSHSYADLL